MKVIVSWIAKGGVGKSTLAEICIILERGERFF